MGVALFARYVGFDRDRAFYPTVMIVIASYYVLFAAMSGSVQTVVIESVVMTLFAAAAVAGFKSSAWIVVVALAGHGVFDAVHGHVIENAGVPAWWPAWCLAYDVGAAASLAWLIKRRPQTAWAGRDCVALQVSLRETLANLSITGHLRCFSDQPVAEIVQCGEPILINNLASISLLNDPAHSGQLALISCCYRAGSRLQPRGFPGKERGAYSKAGPGPDEHPVLDRCHGS